jgi:hypothetical protein
MIPLSYDNVPTSYYLAARHLGYQLTLSYAYTIANIGLDANVDQRTVDAVAGHMTRDEPEKTDAGYLDRLRSIRAYFSGTITEEARGTYPVPVGYYRNDFCTLDAECVAGTECIKQCPLWYVPVCMKSRKKKTCECVLSTGCF